VTQGRKRPKVVSHYLLEKMRRAGIMTAYVILRGGKWDIPAYFADGSTLDMNLAYLVLGLPFGVPFTLDQAYPFVRNTRVAFGFPDIFFESNDAFVQLTEHRSEHDPDLVLGLFPVSHPSKQDTVELTRNHQVRDIILRPSESRLQYTWGIAVWSPDFTRFLHDYVSAKKALAGHQPELSAGHVIKAALEAGLRAEGLVVSHKPCIDIGTAEDLILATARAAGISQREQETVDSGDPSVHER
jgi:glucose-1-phosphate thymidylyltransferase